VAATLAVAFHGNAGGKAAGKCNYCKEQNQFFHGVKARTLRLFLLTDLVFFYCAASKTIFLAGLHGIKIPGGNTVRGFLFGEITPFIISAHPVPFQCG
jgi:hypothetical protein